MQRGTDRPSSSARALTVLLCVDPRKRLSKVCPRYASSPDLLQGEGDPLLLLLLVYLLEMLVLPTLDSTFVTSLDNLLLALNVYLLSHNSRLGRDVVLRCLGVRVIPGERNSVALVLCLRRVRGGVQLVEYLSLLCVFLKVEKVRRKVEVRPDLLVLLLVCIVCGCVPTRIELPKENFILLCVLCRFFFLELLFVFAVESWRGWLASAN